MKAIALNCNCLILFYSNNLIVDFYKNLFSTFSNDSIKEIKSGHEMKKN